MPQMIFVNLPVKDLERSRNFYAKLGYTQNAQFSDDKCASFVVSETIHVMLLVEERFKDFTPKQITDTATSTEVLLCLSAESRDAVDAIVETALAAGGSAHGEPQDHGFMYGRDFQDPDGHIWEHMWMDPAAVEQG
ncbi:VOC family protein [Streptomyces sp. NPDC060194]|uniref:VOC family protein n=1 Tax=Streptomyces sp. NPDC060194 TaxID=3347069 RepID=UPI00364D7FE6